MATTTILPKIIPFVIYRVFTRLPLRHYRQLRPTTGDQIPDTAVRLPFYSKSHFPICAKRFEGQLQRMADHALVFIRMQTISGAGGIV